MGKSLYFKLLGSFVLVIVILAAVATTLVSHATRLAFQTYSNHSVQALEDSLAPALANYYALNNTWEGVPGVVQNPSAWMTDRPAQNVSPTADSWPAQTPDPSISPINSNQRGNGMGGGGMMGMGMRGTGSTVSTPAVPLQADENDADPDTGRHQMGGNSPMMSSGWAMMGHRIIVADSAGQVVSDTGGQAPGATLSNEQLASGIPIQVNGQATGTVIVGELDTSPGTPGGEFLRAAYRSILTAMLAAGVAAVLLGGLIFFQITAPLRKMKSASQAIAAGDLGQRVNIDTDDEVGQLAKAFNHMAESLSQAEMQRQQLIADVAHELRTPLSVIQANLEGMQDGLLPLNAAQIGSLHEETVMLSRLVKDLRLLSLAEAGQLKLERSPVDPGDLIYRTAERLAHVAEERGIEIATEIDQPVQPVLADSDRIGQVIGNLMTNALRYTPSGGRISLAVKKNGQERNSTSSGKTNSIIVSVTDTGSGIPQEDIPFIFDRFYRADKSRTRSSGGSGLGLAIVKQIVEAHGGIVWAESPVLPDSQNGNRGTRISFTLPTA